MKKLLHERLREYGSNCRADYTDWLSQRHANELANEIEKYYQPLPRDTEGNPVRVGMVVDGGIIDRWELRSNGWWSIFDTDDTFLQSGQEGAPIILPDPDSLEKLRDDMREFVEADSPYPGRTKTHDWLARLTAIMERDA